MLPDLGDRALRANPDKIFLKQTDDRLLQKAEHQAVHVGELGGALHDEGLDQSVYLLIIRKDLAEQRVINRFTTAEIKITNHMNNNINSDRDLDGIAEYLVEEMYKGANAYAEGAHY